MVSRGNTALKRLFKKPGKNDTSKFFVGLLFRYSKLRRLELLVFFYPFLNTNLKFCAAPSSLYGRSTSRYPRRPAAGQTGRSHSYNELCADLKSVPASYVQTDPTRNRFVIVYQR